MDALTVIYEYTDFNFKLLARLSECRPVCVYLWYFFQHYLLIVVRYTLSAIFKAKISSTSMRRVNPALVSL